MIETYIVHDSDGDDHHYNNASFHHIFFKTSLAKIRANVQKSLKGGSVKADFRQGENIDHAEKKSSK